MQPERARRRLLLPLHSGHVSPWAWLSEDSNEAPLRGMHSPGQPSHFHREEAEWELTGRTRDSSKLCPKNDGWQTLSFSIYEYIYHVCMIRCTSTRFERILTSSWYMDYAEVLFLWQTARYYSVQQLPTYLLCFVLFCCLSLSFFFFYVVSFLQPSAKDVALMNDSLFLSRSCLASFRSPAVSACVCAPFFQRPLSSCATPRVYLVPVIFCQTAPILQLAAL